MERKLCDIQGPRSLILRPTKFGQFIANLVISSKLPDIDENRAIDLTSSFKVFLEMIRQALTVWLTFYYFLPGNATSKPDIAIIFKP